MPGLGSLAIFGQGKPTPAGIWRALPETSLHYALRKATGKTVTGRRNSWSGLRGDGGWN